MLTSSDKKRLRARAQSLEPHIRIGKNGVTSALLEAIDCQLQQHELVKVRFEQHKDEKAPLLSSITQHCGCELVQVVGHVAILYRKKSPGNTS